MGPWGNYWAEQRKHLQKKKKVLHIKYPAFNILVAFIYGKQTKYREFTAFLTATHLKRD